MNRFMHSARLWGRAALALMILACWTGTARADVGARDWVAQQIAVAPDGTSRALWTSISGSTGGQVVGVWKFDAGGTQTAIGPVYGPYTDTNGPWTARQLVVAPDGTSRLLWTSDGVNGQKVVVWTLDANGAATSTGTVYGPLSDTNGKWFTRQLVVAPDGTSRLLWTNFGASGAQATVWTLNAGGTATSSGTSYGPTSTTAGSLYPQQLLVAADGTSRLLWTVYGTTTSGVYSGDTIAVWTLSAAGAKTGAGASYGPYSGWAVNSFDLDTADNTLRVLWYNASSTVGGDAAGLWVLDASGNQRTVGTVYGPYAGWSAVALTALTDGTSRVQWQRNTTGYRSGGDTFGYWGFDSSGRQSFIGSAYGAYSGWTLGSFGFDATDNTFRLLWNRSDDAAGLWSLNSSGSQSALGSVYGPFTF